MRTAQRNDKASKDELARKYGRCFKRGRLPESTLNDFTRPAPPRGYKSENAARMGARNHGKGEWQSTTLCSMCARVLQRSRSDQRWTPSAAVFGGALGLQVRPALLCIALRLWPGTYSAATARRRCALGWQRPISRHTLAMPHAARGCAECTAQLPSKSHIGLAAGERHLDCGDATSYASAEQVRTYRPPSSSQLVFCACRMTRS